METHDLIHRAEHCLRTGQPNLAMLYMAKAHRQTREYRISIASPGQRAAFAMEELGVAVSHVGEIFLHVAEALTAPARLISEVITDVAEQVMDSMHINTRPANLHQPFGEYPKPREYRPKGYMGGDGGPIFPVY